MITRGFQNEKPGVSRYSKFKHNPALLPDSLSPPKRGEGWGEGI
jgi:hypothetical protein